MLTNDRVAAHEAAHFIMSVATNCVVHTVTIEPTKTAYGSCEDDGLSDKVVKYLEYGAHEEFLAVLNLPGQKQKTNGDDLKAEICRAMAGHIADCLEFHEAPVNFNDSSGELAGAGDVDKVLTIRDMMALSSSQITTLYDEVHTWMSQHLLELNRVALRLLASRSLDLDYQVSLKSRLKPFTSTLIEPK